eukprot:g4103.t1
MFPPRTSFVEQLSLLHGRLNPCGDSGREGFDGKGYCLEFDDDLCKHAICGKPSGNFLEAWSKMRRGHSTDGRGLRDSWQCLCGTIVRDMVAEAATSLTIDRSATAEGQEWIVKDLAHKYPHRLTWGKSTGGNFSPSEDFSSDPHANKREVGCRVYAEDVETDSLKDGEGVDDHKTVEYYAQKILFPWKWPIWNWSLKDALTL